MNNKSDLKKLIENPKFIRVTVIVGVCAVLLIFVSSFVDISSFQRTVDSDEYCAKLEQNLLSIVSQIEGVGEAKIFLTMDNSGENVYLNNTDTKTKSITPVVRGVVIVCVGGDDTLVVSRVMNAVTKSLDISSDKVCVTKLSE
jgi:stage III sporulation protein AG